MLTSVEVINNQGSSLMLELEDSSDGIYIAEVGGLDPVKATIVSSSFAQMDGTQFHSSRRESRNITFKLTLQPDYVNTSVSDLRSQLYNYFMPKTDVELRFYTSDGLVLHISGHVETCESPQFTKEPQMDVSIMCANPDFYNPISIETPGLTTTSMVETPIEYTGSVETGILFTMNINRALPEFTFYHRSPDGTLRTMTFDAPLVAGDVLRISTIPGSKYAKLTRAGTESSVLYGIPAQSDWIEFKKGINFVRVYAVGAAIPYNISYTTKYGAL